MVCKHGSHVTSIPKSTADKTLVGSGRYVVYQVSKLFYIRKVGGVA